jgi:hypothetical protein
MNKGFAALLTSIIISLILLGTVFAANRKAFYFEQSLLLDEYKSQSVFLAHSCIDAAVVRILQDAAYVPDTQDIEMLGGACLIKSVSGNVEKEIEVRAIYKDAYTRLKAKIDLADLDREIYSVQEF